MQSRDHIRRGLMFIISCVLIAIALFAATRCSRQPNQENELAAEAGCEVGWVALNLGRIEPKGTLQILARKADTDGYQQLVYELELGECVSREDLDKLAKGAGGDDDQPVTFLIGHDPKGKTDNYRDRFTFEPDGVTPASDMPQPPRDMHFGEAIWTPAANNLNLEISWYADFAKWIAQQDPSTSEPGIPTEDNLSEEVTTASQCEQAGMSEGSWIRDSDGQIIVYINGECRHATPGEVDAILVDEATPNGE